jgi:isopentenyldiphosphate isomerase
VNFNNPDEQLAVVNEQDVEIGSESRRIVHEKLLLHRAVHILVRSKTGGLYLQKRSAQKDSFPLHWECVGGHVAPGESYEEAAVREVHEELGCTVLELRSVGKLSASTRTGYEFIQIFEATADQTPTPLADEICELELVELTSLPLVLRDREVSPAFLETLKLVGWIAD